MSGDKEKVEKLAEKVDRLEKENKELKQRIDRMEDSEEPDKVFNNKKGVSRRGFLKKLGLGAAGLGAMALTPAASNINFDHDGSVNFNSDGVLMEGNTNLDLNGNNIVQANQIGADNLDVGNISVGTRLDSNELKTKKLLFDVYEQKPGSAEPGTIIYVKGEGHYVYKEGS